ncbi:translational GTPase TypA [Candidatus Saccharibacteria bacterium]|jgi:GTP-binding protein|nr:translational GTPase TypA [Candidatus Saccharibacteria bacterium]
MQTSNHIRNIAIIAHVDHGKTTLLDGLLKQSKTFRDNQAEMSQQLIMDSGDQEHERGITITAKQTSIYHGEYKINIVDTPGHADFSGEVERTLNMADGVLLIVDAQEGPMPQTKFVLTKALELGLKPVVIINKIDKPARRIAEVEDELADLFLELATDDSQLHYPMYYAIGREGKAWKSVPDNPSEHADLAPIFDAIISEIPAPDVRAEGGLQLLVTSLAYDSFLGKYAIGRISRGRATKSLPVTLLKRDGTSSNARIEKLFGYRGLTKEEIAEASAGDIVALVGISDAHIGDTIADKESPEALPTIEIEAPTLRMYLGPNTSPMKGREGDFTTSRQIGDRLKKELETNVSLRVADNGIGFTVSGRGELHLSVLIETMRREGYEFEVGRPQVVTIQEDGIEKEPVEELYIEVSPEFVGAVSQELGARRAELRAQEQTTSGTARLDYLLPTRALIGLRNILLTTTRGTVIMNSLPHGYQPVGAKLMNTRGGALIAFEAGTTTPYALQNAEDRGELFIGPAVEVYAGMIVGLYNRHEDLEINVCKAKHLTNMRSKSSDGAVQLTPYTELSLEQCIDFLNDDELLEVTPKNLRLRKRILDPSLRKRDTKR